MKKTVAFTPEGYEDLKEELARKEKDRVQAVAELKYAREMGDLSENAAYSVARRKLSSCDSRIRYLRHMINVGYPVQRKDTAVIGLGSKIEVRIESESRKFVIVGGHESDIARGRISLYSPVGRQLTGRKAGEKVKIATPAGPVMYDILRVD